MVDLGAGVRALVSDGALLGPGILLLLHGPSKGTAVRASCPEEMWHGAVSDPGSPVGFLARACAVSWNGCGPSLTENIAEYALVHMARSWGCCGKAGELIIP